MRALGGLPVSTRWWTMDAAERPRGERGTTVNVALIGLEGDLIGCPRHDDRQSGQAGLSPSRRCRQPSQTTFASA